MSRWIVSVSSENDDPLVFGPYSRKKAEELAEKFNASVEARSEDESLGAWMWATAYPITSAGITEIREAFGLRRVRLYTSSQLLATL